MLERDQYQELLRSALPSAPDADTVAPNLRTLFTPDSHRNALDPDATVVRGTRGVGKTVWFRALQDTSLREIAANHYRLPRLRRVEPLSGFGSSMASAHPGQRTLEHLLERGHKPIDIWTTVALASLGVQQILEHASWSDRVLWLQGNPEAVENAILEADNQAEVDGSIKLVLFDALDRLHSNRHQADALTRGILQLGLELRTSTRNLRAKIFIRPDMFSAAQLDFTDASKLTSNAADLSWPSTSLYGLLFHLMGSSESTHAPSFRESVGWRDFNQQQPSAPRNLIADQAFQQQIFTAIAGMHMGTNHRKGDTYKWLPNHLADGKRQVSPRSFLSALGRAASITAEKFPASQSALHWDAIRQGVQAASRIRVKEISEDIPWVSTAIEPLGGCQVPIEQSEVTSIWENSDLRGKLGELSGRTDSATSPQNEPNEPEIHFPTGPLSSDYPSLIEELIDLGVMTRRSSGKLDLPDVYRVAFSLGRRGGVPRVHT